MTPAELATLLAVVQSIDGRNLQQGAPEVWYSIIGDLPADACLRAVRAHFRDSTDWLTPAHIVRVVEAERAAYQPTQAELEEAGACPWGRLCHCSHTDPCDHGQVERQPLKVGYAPSWGICPECDKARHAVAAEKRRAVTTRLPRRSTPAWDAPVPSGYPGG